MSSSSSSSSSPRLTVDARRPLLDMVWLRVRLAVGCEVGGGGGADPPTGEGVSYALRFVPRFAPLVCDEPLLLLWAELDAAAAAAACC